MLGGDTTDICGGPMNKMKLSIMVLLTFSLFISSCSNPNTPSINQTVQSGEDTQNSTDTIENPIQFEPIKSPTLTQLPPTPSLSVTPAIPVVPAHDPANWSHVAYLTCTELTAFEWTWGGASSGEYASLTPINGIVNATILYTEYHPICPDFTPILKVPIHDLDTGGVLGYLSCSEVASQGWYWIISKGRWVSSTLLFGSHQAAYDQMEVSMNCSSINPTKVVPVHDAKWDIIGFLKCPEMDSYTWDVGINRGEYIASTTLFGSNYATSYYEEYNPACPSFSP
jgi:hypothetical protein